ncbi:hypothetical protein PoHVEF18_008995 [Penicillium ochrochloron]
MPSGPGKSSIAREGTVGAGQVETNVVVWAPALPGAFNKARNATIFTSLKTWHLQQELRAAFEATLDVDQTFCIGQQRGSRLHWLPRRAHALPKGSRGATGPFDAYES